MGGAVDDALRTTQDGSAETVQPAPAHAGLPRWQDLPDLDLYMDQVLSLMERYVGKELDDSGKSLTASMINNYVKMGMIPPPVRKRYTRMHLAYLVMICVLKPVLPLADINRLLVSAVDGSDIPEFYDAFCEACDRADSDARKTFDQDICTSKVVSAELDAGLRAQAYRKLALTQS